MLTDCSMYFQNALNPKVFILFPSLQVFRNGLPNETKQDRSSLEIDFITFKLIFFSNRIFRSSFIKTRPTFPFRPRLPHPFIWLWAFYLDRTGPTGFLVCVQLCIMLPQCDDASDDRGQFEVSWTTRRGSSDCTLRHFLLVKLATLLSICNC